MLSRTNSDYSRFVYSKVPREYENRLEQGLSAEEQDRIVASVLEVDVDDLLMFETNRAEYVTQTWEGLTNRILNASAKIDDYLAN